MTEMSGYEVGEPERVSSEHDSPDSGFPEIPPDKPEVPAPASLPPHIITGMARDMSWPRFFPPGE